MLWGLLDTLERVGWHVQSFASAAHLSPVCGVRSITGQSQRHLDSWMMSRATCREIFEHGSRASDLSIVAGRFNGARGPAHKSSLDVLSDWLDLPKIAVVDVQQLERCRLPAMPEGVAGLFLDRVRDTADSVRWQTWLEAVYNVPVLGALTNSAKLRSVVEARAMGSPCRELCRALGERLQPTLQLDRLAQILKSQTWSKAPQRLFAKQEVDDRINVAVAFDEAFQGYFADTLDALESRGARICDFSPLHSEALPWDTDVVYLAGVRTEQHAEALAQNVCFRQALRNFAARGGRVYAEGGALAYLCERLVLADGRQFPMAGLLPAIAVAQGAAHKMRPVELTFGEQVWLGEPGTKLRGYADEAWDILPQPDLNSLTTDDDHRYDLVGHDRVIGSRLQVDFAGQPHLMSSFFRPRLGALVSVE
jgi:cobyrinic acid a,c-diamide synthase